MKLRLIIIVLFFIVSCKSEELINVKEQPLFYFYGNINGDTTKIEAGVDDYYLFTNYNIDTSGIYVFSGNFEKTKEPINAPKITFKLTDAGETENFVAENAFDSGFYNYFDANSVAYKYLMNFFAQNPENPPDEITWTINGNFITHNDTLTVLFEDDNVNTVCMIVNYGDTCKTQSCNNFQVSNASCFVYFNYNKVGLSTIQFQEHTSGTEPFTYFWDFGDGFTSTLPNPSHSYESQNKYVVCLTVTDATGCENTYCRDVVTNLSPYYNVIFNSIPDTDYEPQEYFWLFGDDFFSFEENPFHYYLFSSNYHVSLKISYTNSCESTIFNSISVNSNTCENNFEYVEVSDNLFQFTCKEPVGNIAEYFWNFGDGNFSNEPAPQHYFEAGIYTVCLRTTTTDFCETNYCKNLKIDSPDACISNFLFDLTTVERSKCEAAYNFHYKAIPNNLPPWYSLINIIYTTESGEVFSSAGGTQPEWANFVIEESMPYKPNAEQKNTRMLKVNFNCLLFSSLGNSLELKNGKAVFAIAHP